MPERKINNRGWNLRLVSYTRGESHPNARFTKEQVIAIYTSTEKMDYLAALYGCSDSAIAGIWSGKNWKHITKYLERPVSVRRAGRPRKNAVQPPKEDR